MKYKVYWMRRNGGTRTWKLSTETKKPVSKEEADAISTKYDKEYDCETKIVALN